MDKIYIICYEETTIDCENVITKNTGVFDYFHKDLEGAKLVLKDIAQKKVDEIVDEVGEEYAGDVNDTWSDEDRYVSVGNGEDTYDYYIKELLPNDIND